MKIIEHTDKTSGVPIWQLGEDPHFSNHFYTDNPSFSPDGRRFIFMAGPDYFKECQVFLCDIPSRTIQPASAMRGIVAAVMSPTKDEVYFMVPAVGATALYRAKPASGETTLIARIDGLAPMTGPSGANYDLGAISPDGAKYATGVALANGDWAVLEFDLATGAVETVYQCPDIYNPHMNYSPDGRWLSLQINYADRWIDNRSVPVKDPPGLKNQACAWDRRERKIYVMPFAPGPNHDIQGHQCWAGYDGLMLATIISHVRGRWQGNIWAARLGDAEARCVSDAFDWRHPSATLDGKTIVCDEWENKDLYLLDTATGRHEFLCHSGSVDWDKIRGAPPHSLQQWHPHPTIGPDGHAVLFNSNRTGTAHAYVAFRK